MPNNKLRHFLDVALLEVTKRLETFDIDDDGVLVKIKTFKPVAAHAVAMYRSYSQFRSRPIVWVNSRFVEMCDDAECDPLSSLVDTLLHEYGHVLYEYARIRMPDLREDIDAVTDNEEDFAETFSVVVKNNAASPTYRKFIRRYMADLRRKPNV